MFDFKSLDSLDNFKERDEKIYFLRETFMKIQKEKSNCENYFKSLDNNEKVVIEKIFSLDVSVDDFYRVYQKNIKY